MVTHIEIDKLRKLKYDFNAIADVESLTGKTMSQLLIALYNSSFYAARALLWAGLKADDANLQNSTVGIIKTGALAEEWIEKSGGNVGDLVQVIISALTESGWLTPISEASEGDGQGESTGVSDI